MDGQGSKNDCSQYGGDQEDREDEEFRRPDASAEGCLMKSPLKTREGPEDSNLMAQGPPAQSEEGRLTQVSPENSRNDAVPRRGRGRGLLVWSQRPEREINGPCWRGAGQSRAGRDTEYAVHDLRPIVALLISAISVVSYL
ncbi:hypothetical protein NDU88_009856 [Pleurodeles waltl]|uniref:Uncharacterized protein n=1 Tax=Pleurodeles waltl TaxID=8319 RepID=A0AAV7QYN6_PLEWA|nr:hypothetical protein NDU88_009856 [Pleurodeles waltl]